MLDDDFKTVNMKAYSILVRWLLPVLLAVGGTGSMAQSQSPTQMVCMGDQEYHVDPNPLPGAVYTWSLTGGGTITSGNGTNTVIVNWTTPGGPYTLSVFTTVNGCAGPPKSVDVTVVEAPVGPTLADKVPPGMAVCEGTPVSATFNPGTGGIDCTDEFEYSYDNSGIWATYSPGTPLATAGHTLVEIRGRRAGCNVILGCNGTPWEVLASWNVTQLLPLSVTITASADPVCAGTSVTYTAVVVNGGPSPTYAWRVNGDPIVGTGSTYTYVPSDGDVITCEVLSSEQCATPNPATGTFIPIVTVPPNTSDIWHN